MNGQNAYLCSDDYRDVIETLRNGRAAGGHSCALRNLNAFGDLITTSHDGERLILEDECHLGHTCRVPSYVQRALGGEPQSLVRLACDTH